MRRDSIHQHGITPYFTTRTPRAPPSNTPHPHTRTHTHAHTIPAAMVKTRVTEMLGIEHPVVMGGLTGVGTPELAAAVSNAGGLGLFAVHNAGSPAAAREVRWVAWWRGVAGVGWRWVALGGVVWRVIGCLVWHGVLVVWRGAGGGTGAVCGAQRRLTGGRTGGALGGMVLRGVALVVLRWCVCVVLRPRGVAWRCVALMAWYWWCDGGVVWWWCDAVLAWWGVGDVTHGTASRLVRAVLWVSWREVGWWHRCGRGCCDVRVRALPQSHDVYACPWA